MQFTILGEVGVHGADGQIEVQRPQRRAVLAYLLLNARQQVTLDRLIDAIWADEAPSSARTQIHGAVSTLRQTLRGTDLADRIQTTADGYTCTVGDGELDLLAFRAQVRRAAEEMADQRTEEASESLRAALGMWRGTPLAGVNAAFVEPARARLEEERLDACGQLAACELDLGREAELIPMLTELVEAHLQREQLVGQLLIALYRTGRQAEAIRRFAETQRFLAEELGIDPGPELSAIHAAILRADPELTTAAMSPALGAGLPPTAPPEPSRTDGDTADGPTAVPAAVAAAPAPVPVPDQDRRRRLIRLGLAVTVGVAAIGAAGAFWLQTRDTSGNSAADNRPSVTPSAPGSARGSAPSLPPSASVKAAPTGPVGTLAAVRVFNIDGDCKTQSERLPACRLGLAKNPYVTYDLNNVVPHRVWHGDVLMADCMVVNGIRIEDEHGVGTPNWFRVHLADVPGETAWLPAVRTHDDPDLPVCSA